MDIKSIIQQNYNSLTQKEKDLAQYILNYGENFKNINITILAEQVGVSSSTITRFSKKLGCNNFVELKMKLNSWKNHTKKKKEQGGLLSDVYSYYSEAIERTRSFLDEELIYKIVGEIKKAHKIYIYGVGSSGLSSTEMMQRLIRMGFNVYSITDPHMMIINSVVVSSNDLVIGISNSGTTKEVMDSLRVCKKNNARIIGITSFEKSSMGELSDELIVIPNSSFVGGERFINSQFTIMYLFDLISMILLEDEERRNKMQKTIDAITR